LWGHKGEWRIRKEIRGKVLENKDQGEVKGDLEKKSLGKDSGEHYRGKECHSREKGL